MKKKINRIRRASCVRYKLKKSTRNRLVVHRTSNHIYAQVIGSYEKNNKVLTSASTLEKIFKKKLKNTGNKEAAYTIGKVIAERALKKGIQNISFDRSGFKYHGRIKFLAEAARKFGLKF